MSLFQFVSPTIDGLTTSLAVLAAAAGVAFLPGLAAPIPPGFLLGMLGHGYWAGMGAFCIANHH